MTKSKEEKTNENAEEKANLIVRNAIRKALRKEVQFKNIDGSIDVLPPINIRGDAFGEIIDRLNVYIESQLNLLRYFMPRFSKGENEGKIKKKTIDSDYLKGSEFPQLKKPSGDSLKKNLLDSLTEN